MTDIMFPQIPKFTLHICKTNNCPELVAVENTKCRVCISEDNEPIIRDTLQDAMREASASYYGTGITESYRY